MQLLCLTTVLTSSSGCQDSLIISYVTVNRQLHLHSFFKLSALVLKFVK